jgi:hypothetical protein
MSPMAKGPKSAGRKPKLLDTTALIWAGVAVPSSTIRLAWGWAAGVVARRGENIRLCR